jgi:hypothetical protein
MTVTESEFSPALLKKIRERFDADPRIVRLRAAKENAVRNGRYVAAFEVSMDIDTLFQKTLENYAREMRDEAVSFDEETRDVPRTDKDEMIEQLMTLFIACDIIESAVLEVNDILHRSKPDLHITTFDDIVELSNIAKGKLQYLQKNSEYMDDLVWGERCDDMYEMMQNKARAIIRRRKESNNWGENQRRIANGGKDDCV